MLLQLLQLLAERPRQLVTRQQIKQGLWPNSDRIDTERRLNTAMRALRAALNDPAETPEFIETVRSEGYRWIGSNAPPPRTADRPWIIVAGALLLLAAIGSALFTMRPAVDSAPATPLALIQAQASLDRWRASPTYANLRDAERAVAAAMKDAPSSPAAHVVQAQLALESRWDWGAAAREYGEALRIDPSNADARLGLAWLKVNRGDDREALADANRLMLDSVLTGDRRTELGWLLIRAGRPDLAKVACPPGVASLNGLSCAHTALAAVGELEAARAAGVRLMQATKASPALIATIEREPAEAAYKKFLEWRARDFLPPGAFHFDRAQVLADAGYGTEALDQLDSSIAAHEPLAMKIKSSPSFMALRTNPRFKAMVARVGLPA